MKLTHSHQVSGQRVELIFAKFPESTSFFFYWSSLFACWFDLVFCGHRLYSYVYLQAMASSIHLIQLPDKYFQKTIFVMVLYSVTLPQHSSLTLLILLDFPSDLLFLFSYYPPPTCASPSPFTPGVMVLSVSQMPYTSSHLYLDSFCFLLRILFVSDST